MTNDWFQDTGGGQYPPPNALPRDVAKRAPMDTEPTRAERIERAARALLDEYDRMFHPGTRTLMADEFSALRAAVNRPA